MSRKAVRIALITLSFAVLLNVAVPGGASPLPAGPFVDLTGWWLRLSGWLAAPAVSSAPPHRLRALRPQGQAARGSARPPAVLRGLDEGLGTDPNGGIISHH
jgi:hypothetical protein